MLIITATKFTHGAWISILLMLILMLMFTLIRRHYDWFDGKVRVEDASSILPSMPIPAPAQRQAVREHVVVPVDGINKISLAAIAYARERSGRVTAVHISDSREDAEKLRSLWAEAVPDVPLLVIESPWRAFVAPMLTYLDLLERTEADERIVVVMPRFVVRHWWERLLHNQDALRLKPHLRKRPRVRVVDFPYQIE